MKIAVIADLHGNWTATQALEKDLKKRKVDQIFCLGDLIGKGPSSDKTCDWAFANCNVILGGNWDYGVSAKIFPKDEFYWNQLGEKRLKKLSQLPREQHFYFSGLHLRLFHGRPVTSGTLLLPTLPANDLSPYFKTPDHTFQGIIYADIHRSFYRVLNSGILINTGSIGNSLGVPNVLYAILEGEEGKDSAPFDVTMVSLPYHNQLAVEEALQEPHLPHLQTYINEILTGIYSKRV